MRPFSPSSRSSSPCSSRRAFSTATQRASKFAEVGLPFYISPSDCIDKTSESSGDGARTSAFSMDQIYRKIAELSAIFDIEDKGAALVAELKGREAAAVASVASIRDKHLDVPVVYWFSSPEVSGEAYLAGKNGAPAYVMNTLGVRNIVTTEEEWPLIGWETINAADPKVIVMATMERRRWGADDPAVKTAFLKTDPVVSQLDAVKGEHFIYVDAQSMNPTLRTIDGIEALAGRPRRVTGAPRQGGMAFSAGLAGGALLLFAAILFAMVVGEIRIPLATVAETLGNRLLGTAAPENRMQASVVWEYRLSRAVVAACCGAALALSGAVLQALLRSPLAEPYVLGISAGASTGAVAVIVSGVGGGVIGLSTRALVGAIAAFLLVGLLAAGAGGTTERVILAGVAGSQLFNAATAYIVTKSASAEQARSVMFWLLGNLGSVRWPDVWLAAPVALGGLLLCLLHGRALDAFSFGGDSAALGVETTRTRVTLFGLTALLTAAMVAIVGSIGSIGLVIPHVARFFVGPEHLRLLPVSVLTGAIFLVLADVASRVLVPGQVLPIGVVTALVGAPVFAVILYRMRGRP